MKAFIVLCAVVAAATATPGYLYGYQLGAPLGHDGRVVDTPEVAHAKAAHLAAHAQESARNSVGYAYAPALAYTSAPYVHQIYAPVVAHGPPAPLAADGRVIDTPEVAHAKAAHLAAHAQEASKFAGHAYGALPYAYSPAYSYGYGAAPLGHDGRVVDTPEVAHAKAAHLAAHHAAAVESHH